MTGFQSQRRAGRLFRRLLVATLAALLIWTAGLFSFAGSIPKSIEDPARHTDSIIVLTGGSGRLEEGLGEFARDLQLPGVRGQHLPGALRAGLRFRYK